MSETTIVNFPTTNKSELIGLNMDRVTELWDEEFDKAEELGVEPTIGNCMTLLCKGCLRAMMGDEKFNCNLEDLETEEEMNEIMRQAFDAVKVALENVKIKEVTED